MTDNTTKDSDILKYAIANCIIDFGSIRSQYEECERMNLLDSYEYKIFESGGWWYCRLPDGRRIKRKNRRCRKRDHKDPKGKKEGGDGLRREDTGGSLYRME